MAFSSVPHWTRSYTSRLLPAHCIGRSSTGMDVDHKVPLGSFGVGVNQKKRPISFRLTVPSKRQSLPYAQRTSASRYHSFYVAKDDAAEPDTPTSTTLNWDDDPFYDSDAEPSTLFAPYETDSHYAHIFEHDSVPQPPKFTSPVPITEASPSAETSPSPRPTMARPMAVSVKNSQDRLEKSYQRVESQQLFKDSPIWSALLEAKRKGPSGASY
jgi:hypothetical protein